MDEIKRTAVIMIGIFGLSLTIILGLEFLGHPTGSRAPSPAGVHNKTPLPVEKIKKRHSRLPKPETFGRVLQPGEPGPPPDPPPFMNRAGKAVLPPADAPMAQEESGAVQLSLEEIKEMQKKGIVAY